MGKVKKSKLYEDINKAKSYESKCGREGVRKKERRINERNEEN